MTYRLPSAPRYLLRDGKIPVDWRTGRAGNPADPALHLTLDRARTLAAERGQGIGFASGGGYWFLDLDRALEGTVWNADAVEACRRLPGAYVEVSQSGRGLHLIGRGTVPPHAVRGPNRELYTDGHYCALTETHARGDAETDLTAAVSALAAEWFPPKTADTVPLPDEGPCPEWDGIADDGALIERMLASAPGFGGKPSFKQLWEANPDALGAAYPDSGGRAYDASAADVALMHHLAFWTGKDAARMERLARRSALVREKWDRPDYMAATVGYARSHCRDVHNRKHRSIQEPAPEASTIPAAGIPPLVLPSDFARAFEGCVYIEDRYAAVAPDGTVLEPRQFRASFRYGGHMWVRWTEGRPSEDAWDAFTCSDHWRPPSAHSVCFRPEHAPGAVVEEDGRRLLNVYRPAAVPCAPGDTGPFDTFLAKLLPGARERAILLAYMCSLVRNPGVKFQWAPLLQGVQGNGKTFLMECLAQAVGDRMTHFPNTQDLDSRFNDWMEFKLFVGVEEIMVGDRRSLLDSLLTMVTNKRIEIQPKGGAKRMGDNRANFMFASNHKDAVPLRDGDRRYCILYTAQQSKADLARDGMDGDWFPRLYAWARDGGFAHVTHKLRTADIPAEFDPAGLCHRAPETAGTREAFDLSRDPAEQAVIEAVESGMQGFRGGWISSHWLASLLEAKRFRTTPAKMRELVRRLGYLEHPALPNGRVNNPLAGDNGTRPRLWVRESSIAALNIASAAEAAAAYAKLNGPGTDAGFAETG
jgi:hypothetical protein